MTAVRRLAYAALGFAYLQIVFGAVVRISGSGLGCGNHWPKCYGHWFPPFDQPTLVIEWTHRLIAASLSVTILALLLTALARRREPGVGGPGGVLAPVALAFALVCTAAAFGAITVKIDLHFSAVVVHLGIAMVLLATLAVAVIRAGGLGGAAALAQAGTPRAARGAAAAAALGLVVVLLGALTANVPNASASCLGFPWCRLGTNPAAGGGLHVHLTHRVLAFLLFFHVLGISLAFRKRAEAPVVVRAAWLAFAAIVLQIVIAAGMVEMRLPPVFRSAHQAVGTLVWLSLAVLAVLARRAARGASVGAGVVAPAATPRRGLSERVAT